MFFFFFLTKNIRRVRVKYRYSCGWKQRVFGAGRVTDRKNTDFWCEKQRRWVDSILLYGSPTPTRGVYPLLMSIWKLQIFITLIETSPVRLVNRKVTFFGVFDAEIQRLNIFLQRFSSRSKIKLECNYVSILLHTRGRSSTLCCFEYRIELLAMLIKRNVRGKLISGKFHHRIGIRQWGKISRNTVTDEFNLLRARISSSMFIAFVL